MKRKIVLFSFIALVIILNSCLLDKEDGDKISIIVMSISSKTYVSGLILAPPTYWREVYSQKEEGGSYETSGAWGIEGFKYERGYAYKLLVRKTILKDPPQDSSNVRYKLIRVLSKKIGNTKDRESIVSIVVFSKRITFSPLNSNDLVKKSMLFLFREGEDSGRGC